MSEKILTQALTLAQSQHQVIGRTEDYYITLEQLQALMEEEE